MMANHGIVYPVRQAAGADGIYCVRLHHYFEILRGFPSRAWGALPQRVAVLPPRSTLASRTRQLRVCVGHKFTFISKVCA